MKKIEKNGPAELPTDLLLKGQSKALKWDFTLFNPTTKTKKIKKKMGLLSFELRTYGFLRLNRKWSYKTVALFPATNAPG